MQQHIEKRYSVRVFTFILFVVLAIAGVGFSIYLLLVANSLYMYILAILFTTLAVISGLFNVFAATFYYRSYFYDDFLDKVNSSIEPLKKLPTVAIMMPVYNEDTKTVEKNMLRLFDVKYDKKKIRYYLGDDSTDNRISSELKGFCEKHGIMYVHRNDRKGFKAGNINNILKRSKEEFVAIFDYDEYLTNTNFLMELLPYFKDKKLAYVQTEKAYSRTKSLFAQSVSLFDAFFFKFIQQARAMDNTAIFAGSCAVIRKSVLDATGGFPEYVIEDTFFSFISDMKGYRSLYIPKIYAVGKPIDTFTKLVKQQWRYNYGDTQFLKYIYKYKKPKDLSPLSHIDYITHGFGLNYISVVLLFFTIISIMIVFSAVHFINLSWQQILQAKDIGLDLEIFGALAFVLSLIFPVILTKIYFKSIKKGVMILLLNFSLVIVRTRAAVAAIFNLSPMKIWGSHRESTPKRSVIFALRNTTIELSFAAALILFAGLAVWQKNFAGGVWLIWYAALYSIATVFFYKYG